jgi:uncharacterized HAD superfamily protein
MLISLDFDEILFPFMEPFLQWLNPRLHTIGYDKPIFLEDPTDYKIHSIIGLEHTNRFVKEFYDTDAIRKIEPEVMARECVLAFLSEGHDIVITTGRPDAARECTVEQLTRFFPLFPIHYCNQYASTGFREKAEVCKSLSAAVHVDDQAPHVNGVIERGLKGVFVEKPWKNTTPLSSKAVIAKNWTEIRQGIHCHV